MKDEVESDDFFYIYSYVNYCSLVNFDSYNAFILYEF